MNKKSKIKYLVSLIIFFLVVFSFIFGTFFKMVTREIPGASAEGVNYILSEDGTTLTISGSGEITYSDVNKSIKTASKVIIEEGITSIGSLAFCDLFNSRPSSLITSVKIPNSVTSIASGAFTNCTGLTDVNIPDSLTTIVDGAFCGCSSLKNIDIPTSIKSIGQSAFFSCSNLNNITIPYGVESIGETAFFNCTSLTNINIPNSVKSIGVGAFKDCSQLKEVKFSNEFYIVGGGEGAQGFEPGPPIPGFTSFKNFSSNKTGNFAKVTGGLIEDGLTSIGDGAFQGCVSLKSVTIPSSVTFIGVGAFKGCGNLEEIKFEGENIPTLGEGCFENISKSVKVYLNDTLVNNESDSALINTLLEDAKIPITSFNKSILSKEMFSFITDELTYDGTEKNFTIIVPDGLTSYTLEYSSDNGTTWTTDSPREFGTYKVKIVVKDDDNYFNDEIILDSNFKINKANPTANLFTFSAPSNSVYSGNNKDASVMVNSDIDGMGSNITVGYYSDAACTTAVDPKNVGTYYVGITVNEGSNYNATDTPLTKDSWNFSITKAEPTADLFTFSAPSNLVYSGNNKDASVIVNSGIEGIGSNITVGYYSDAACTTAVDPKNVGTYYVGITVNEGSNYKAADTPLTKDSWKFSINKAEPVLDFQVVYGGISGGEPIILGEKKEIFYGTSLKDAENILPNSKIGTWTLKNPDEILNKVGEKYIELTFTPNDIKNYDWSKIPGWDENTKTLNLKFLISTVVDKSSWGTEMTSDGIKYYVNEDGTTSAEITDTEGICWIKEKSYDVEQGKVTSAWYGVDNSSEVFEPGSRLCVRWINKQENPQEWNTYNPMIDESETQNIPDFKKWLFIAEVIHPDGVTKYTVLPNSVPFYVQLGDDWDVEDVEARFISPDKDESVRTTYIRSLSYPAGTDEFMKLDLLHFSPYVIYDKDNPSNNNEIKTEEQPGNSIDNKGENKTNNGYIIFVIVGSGTGIAALALLWWWLYKKKRKNRKLIAESILAKIGKENLERI